MIANAAFIAALTVFALVTWLASELTFLAQYRAFLLREYGSLIAGAVLLLFFNLVATYYALGRWLFLRDTGRKLTHLDRQLAGSDALFDELQVADGGRLEDYHVAGS
jgi:hypothetical protein